MESGTEQSEKAKKEVLTRRKLITEFASLLALLAATATITFSVSSLFKSPKEIKSSITPEIAVLQRNLEQSQKAIEDMQKRLDAIVKIDQKTTTGQQVAAIGAEIKATSSRLETLERGLLDSPEKALSVPLLRNDLQNLKLSYKQDIDNLAKSMDRVYDQNKWFIGLMFTMAVGLIGLAISSFVQSRRN